MSRDKASTCISRMQSRRARARLSDFSMLKLCVHARVFQTQPFQSDNGNAFTRFMQIARAGLNFFFFFLFVIYLCESGSELRCLRRFGGWWAIGATAVLGIGGFGRYMLIDGEVWFSDASRRSCHWFFVGSMGKYWARNGWRRGVVFIGGSPVRIVTWNRRGLLFVEINFFLLKI